MPSFSSDCWSLMTCRHLDSQSNQQSLLCWFLRLWRVAWLAAEDGQDQLPYSTLWDLQPINYFQSWTFWIARYLINCFVDVADLTWITLLGTLSLGGFAKHVHSLLALSQFYSTIRLFSFPLTFLIFSVKLSYIDMTMGPLRPIFRSRYHKIR